MKFAVMKFDRSVSNFKANLFYFGVYMLEFLSRNYWSSLGFEKKPFQLWWDI